MRFFIFVIVLVFMIFFYGCGSEGDIENQNISTSGDYVVFAWNDLGMHCLNPTYDSAVILPPYNTVFAQVVKRGNPPQIITKNLEVEYSIINNTKSYGKRDYGQFWDNCKKLFGIELAHDTGLNLEDPGIHNSLAGTMVNKGDHFVVNGIPVTPVDDNGVWNAYQVAEIKVKSDTGNILAQTRTTVPTSDEIHCDRCHGNNAFIDILQKHDSEKRTKLISEKPVLCASCHGSPALGANEAGSSRKYLSQAIHGSHASRGAACMDCHPGTITKCSRSIAHTTEDGNCITCHGDMSKVASTIKSGERIPWVNEPKCATCHTNVAQVDTGDTLYRNAKGHGTIYCASCHSSPHAMVPSREDSDNYQAIQYQGKALSIGSCGVCHSNSKGEGASEFMEVHGGSNPETKNACYVCHTAVTANTGSWPHSYQWKARKN